MHTNSPSNLRPATIFDLDGTLADSVTLIEETLHATIVDAGHDAESHEVRAKIGRPLDVMLAELTHQDVDHDNIATLVQSYRSAYRPAVEAAGASLLIPGVPEMLERLRAAGHAIGVVTAKTTFGAEHLLEMIGIRHFVDVLVGTERVAHGKPAPDSGLLAMAELGVLPENSWYVGDATSDITMAIAAGMKPLGVTSGVANREELLAAGAHAVATTPDEIAVMVLDGIPEAPLR
ncbi:MAG: HAD family hydrolase [Arachnia sp.]